MTMNHLIHVITSPAASNPLYCKRHPQDRDCRKEN